VRTPIIFVTAIGGDETEAASAYASGAVDFIFTPVLPNVLRAKVSAFVDLFLQSRERQRAVRHLAALELDRKSRTVLASATRFHGSPDPVYRIPR
jgi:response regulator RpfG family c-di-GMP phosphodiesterase